MADEDEVASDAEGGSDDENGGDEDVDLEALALIIQGMEDEEVLTQFTAANEQLRELESQAAAELGPVNTEKLQLSTLLIQFMQDSNLDAIELADPEGGDPWYMRLGQTVVTASKPSPKLFSAVISDLTPETFRDKVVELEDDRTERLAKWTAAQREQAIKTLRAQKREWTKVQKDSITAPYSKRPRTSAAKAMAATAVALGGKAVANVKTILKAGLKRSAIVEGEGEGGGGSGGAVAGDGDRPPDPTDEAQIAALMAPPPPWEPERFRTGRGGVKNPTRPQLPLTGQLTRRQLLAEVLYVMIVERSKGRRWKIEIRSTKGRPKVLLEAGQVPVDVLTKCQALRSAREQYASLAAEWRKKKALQGTIMRMCEPRIRAYLEATDPEHKKSKRILPCGDGEAQRTITIVAVEEPKVTKSLNMWDVSTLVDAAVAEVAKAMPTMDMDALFDGAARLIDDRVTSTLLTSILAKTSDMETERTTTVSRVKVIRAGAVPAPGTAVGPV
jgi:hypothetical protein